MKKTLLLLTTLFTIIISFFVCPVYAAEDEEDVIKDASYIYNPNSGNASSISFFGNDAPLFNNRIHGFEVVASSNETEKGREILYSEYGYSTAQLYLGIGNFTLFYTTINFNDYVEENPYAVYQFIYKPFENQTGGLMSVYDYASGELIDSAVCTTVDQVFPSGMDIFASRGSRGTYWTVYRGVNLYYFKTISYSDYDNPQILKEFYPLYNETTEKYGYKVLGDYPINQTFLDFGGEVSSSGEAEDVDPGNEPMEDIPYIDEDPFLPYYDADVSTLNDLQKLNNHIYELSQSAGNLQQILGDHLAILKDPITEYLQAYENGFFYGSKVIGDIVKTPYATLVDNAIDQIPFLGWLFNAACGVSCIVIILGGLI